MHKIGCAIIGSGNIGTDLMIKILRNSKHLDLKYMIGIDAASDGLARAKRMSVKTIHEGLAALEKQSDFEEVKIFFDATSVKAHHYNFNILKKYNDKFVVDLTPAAIGPFTVPAVNLNIENVAQNVNMVTCGGQATIPMVAAVNQVAKVHYGEIVASIASKSAGPGTRANIDEFTETTSKAIEKVGGANKGKAIIVLNPAEPALMMRNTVLTLSENGSESAIEKSIATMVEKVQQYVPGYRLKQKVQFEEISANEPVFIEGIGLKSGLKTTIMLEVEGAGHYLPAYAGNLDIMTSAALATGEQVALLKYL